MEMRVLSGTDLTVSRLCLGTMTFGAQVDESEAASMIDVAFDAGINFIDTANVYNAGASETILGRVLGGRRERVVLATKVGIKTGERPGDVGLSRATIRLQIEESLRRLRTDFVDLYYLHTPDPATPLEKTLSALDELVREGKVRHVGASNFAAWQICRMQWLAETGGWPAMRITQPMYNLLARGVEQEFLPMCRSLGVSIVAYNPLAGGLLTGKHRLAEGPAAGTRFDRMPAYQDRYWRAENFEAVSRLEAAAERDGRSLISLALGWLLHHTSVDCAVIGASSVGQLVANLQAADEGPCSPDALAACDAVWPIIRGVSPTYSR